MGQHRLFLACFFSLIATAFGFIIRAMIMDQLASEFGLSKTESGQIFSVGLWPFAISIVLFSLFIDQVGYGKAMVFAILCHVASAVITICAPYVLAAPGSDEATVLAGQKAGYWMLYLGNFVVALGNGTVEAVINPVVATIYSREKTKWLNILHAGWPGGLVLGGLLTLAMGPESPWQYKVMLIFLPIVIYTVLLIGCRFPVSERVAAGVSYRETLREFGAFGALIVSALIAFQVMDVLKNMELIPQDTQYVYFFAGVAILSAIFGIAVQAVGRPMFIFLLLIMIPLATTELGTDSWITSLMEPQMKELGLQAGWVLVYTSAIMMILRFFAGPIVHRFSPLGLLAASSIVACLGLVALSRSTGLMILAAATLYGFGKTFFWPTMLGVVAEQFPKGGALTLNACGGVGMLGVGVGAIFLGIAQDREVEMNLAQNHPAIHAQVVGPKSGVLGEYKAVDQDKALKLDEADAKVVQSVDLAAKQATLMYVASLPLVMLACYLILIVYFKMKGGYKAEVLAGHAANDAEFTGGVAGPMEA